jgi:hypothetical protein
MRRLACSSLFFAVTMFAADRHADRVVIIKVDGLPEDLLERYVAENGEGARDGHSRLPWIEHVFARNGTWMENFYVRGISLSAPSWSMLDTGRHLEIRGNAEYDRYTLRVFDYLNFFPFYVANSEKRQADMPGVELLDQNHVPLLIDRFPFAQRYQSFQLYQRGVRWKTLESSFRTKFTSRPIKDLFDEWQTGFSLASAISEQTEREVLEKLRNPDIHYIDYFTGDFDHTSHLTGDRVAILHVLESLDAMVGRVWAGIALSPYPKSTALILISDHGMNTSPLLYSQGYNLIDWFNSAAGGGHHVLTNRHPMTEFKLKGLDPFVSEVISPSSESPYLGGESSRYPTAVMDLDGNERASISLRNNSLNAIHILLDQLMHKKLPGRVRHAALEALFQTLGRVRPVWRKNVDELSEELRLLHLRIEDQQKLVDAPHHLTKEDRANGAELDHWRQVDRLDEWKLEERTYSAYVATMNRLLGLNPADFDPGKFNMEDLIPKKSLGEPNSLGDLQRYVAGPAPGGLVAAADGSLDWEQSFRHIDYFPALSGISVRNNVQKGVGARPVDFIAVAVKDSIWLWRDPQRQALIETRHNAAGALELRYRPVAHLKQDESGELNFDAAAWGAGLPLELFEDPLLNLPEAGRAQWLSEWHQEHEWLKAVHRTKYSNAMIGLVEQMSIEPVPSRFDERKRELRRADMLVVANDHWNFNVRGFNPGGNHGSFLRISTHSVLLAAGGEQTGIPSGLRVETPYDSLSFVPTILTLMGKPEASLPGPVIAEMVTR